MFPTIWRCGGALRPRVTRRESCDSPPLPWKAETVSSPAHCLDRSMLLGDYPSSSLLRARDRDVVDPVRHTSLRHAVSLPQERVYRCQGSHGQDGVRHRRDNPEPVHLSPARPNAAGHCVLRMESASSFFWRMALEADLPEGSLIGAHDGCRYIRLQP
jgi:hypothetical protein